MAGNQLGMVPLFRADSGYTDMEKRQLFLRSYQFSRKRSLSERIKKSLFRVKRVLWVRLRSAKKIRKMVWFRFRHGLFFGYRRRRFFLRLRANNCNYGYQSNGYACFW